jgi:cell division protein FtsB
MKPTEGLYDKDSDLEKIIDKLTRENTKLKEDVADLKKKLEFVVEEYRNKGTLSRGPWSKVLENFFTIPVPWFKDHGA